MDLNPLQSFSVLMINC